MTPGVSSISFGLLIVIIARFIDILEFLSGDEYSVFYGSHGNWTWGLGTGFYIGVIAAFIVFLGAIKMK